MAIADQVQIDVHLRDGALASLPTDVREGLGSEQKTLPPKYFYDARGSELFERITELPEYYPTRAEQAVLDRVAASIVAELEPEELVELGPGSARKTHALLDPMVARGAARYVPVDVSESAVLESAARLADTYGDLEIHGVVGDFEHHLDRIPHNGHRRLIAFLGGTIGNLDAAQRGTMLSTLKAGMGPDDRLLIGTDLVKDRGRLEAAYNDSAGVTAEFNRNVLHVLNQNLEADLDPERFEHIALYDEGGRWIEMRLRARMDHSARIEALDMDVRFERGEHIRTEISCKFTRAALAAEYEAAGLRMAGWHTDPDGLFALSLAAPDGAGGD